MKTRKLLTTVIAFLAFAVTTVAQTVPSYVPTNGLVGYWGFNGNANDQSGNGNNGTVNGATLTTDRNGNANSAYSFDGTTSYISVPHNAAFNLQQATWNVWVKKTSSSTGNGMYIFGKRDNAQHHITFCTGSIEGSCQLGWATAQATGINAGNISNGWHLLSLTYDQTLLSNNLKLYYDGGLQGTATIQSFSFSNGDIRFGIEMNNSYWQLFNGLIDDASVYNRILTQSEITQLYTATSSTQTLCTKTTQPYNVNVGDATHDGSTYAWSISPATPSAVMTGNGTNAITIDWTNAPNGTYTLQAIETSIDGCVSTAVSATINLSTTPAAPVAPATQTFCTASTVANLTAAGTNLQ